MCHAVVSFLWSAQTEVIPPKVKDGSSVNMWIAAEHDCGTDDVCPEDDTYTEPDSDGTEGDGLWNGNCIDVGDGSNPDDCTDSDDYEDDGVNCLANGCAFVPTEAESSGNNPHFDRYFFQSIKVTFQENGGTSYINGDDITFDFPVGMTLADVDNDGDYTDEIAMLEEDNDQTRGFVTSIDDAVISTELEEGVVNAVSIPSTEEDQGYVTDLNAIVSTEEKLGRGHV